MKVLHLFKSYLGITANWAYNLMQFLPEEVEIHIGTIYYEPENFYSSRFHFIPSYFGGLHLLNLKLNKKQPLGLIRKVAIRLARWILGGEIGHLVQYGREKKIDIVHAHFGHVGWHFRMVARRLKKPLVISFYGYDYEFIPYHYPKFIQRYKWLFHHAALFLVEGEHGREILKRMGCPEQKIRIASLGVEVDKIPFISRKKEPGKLKLVQIAALTGKKGQLYSIEAFDHALRKCPDMELTLVGGARDPGYAQKIKTLIREKNLESKITLLDRIDYQQLYTFLGQFQLFIHPSCYTPDRDCEGGAPIVLLDAQATGLPVLSTRHCDIPGEVIHEKTGLLTGEAQVQELSEAIVRFYQMEDDVFQEFARNARSHVEAHFDIRKNAQQWNTIYHELLTQDSVL